MALKKTVADRFEVESEAETTFTRAVAALEEAGFRNIEADAERHRITARYKKISLWGSLQIDLEPAGGGSDLVRLHLSSRANVDNVYALFRSPGKKIIEEFRSAFEERN